MLGVVPFWLLMTVGWPGWWFLKSFPIKTWNSVELGSGEEALQKSFEMGNKNWFNDHPYKYAGCGCYNACGKLRGSYPESFIVLVSVNTQAPVITGAKELCFQFVSKAVDEGKILALADTFNISISRATGECFGTGQGRFGGERTGCAAFAHQDGDLCL